LSTNAMGKEKKYKLILIKGIHSGAKAIKWTGRAPKGQCTDWHGRNDKQGQVSPTGQGDWAMLNEGDFE
jgi:hypothetical protein